VRNANLIDRVYNWLGALFVLLVIPVNVCWWIGISPAFRRAILAASMSTQTTSFPASARQAPVTRPT